MLLKQHILLFHLKIINLVWFLDNSMNKQENDIEKAIKYNDIHLKEIKFNNNGIG
ncbi:hypothetical protein [Clostridium estertheticum]|uniref:hypothetical protein n=1 Tax=Clostridium estertheticum TaxID=238834 RepID=UPI001CF55010|nr:hypothetical protein [Clostridium estertheticum]MCB2361879.1 hypothetical protein [Clostridium estertheticum]